MLEISRRAISRRATLCGVAAVAMTGLLGPARAQRALKFGVIVPSRELPFYRRLLRGMQGAATEVAVELQVVDTTFDLARELSAIENFIASKLDGLIVAPVAGGDPVEAMTVRKAQSAGVPVGVVGSRIAGADVTVIVEPGAVGAIQAQVARTLAKQAGLPAARILYLYSPGSDYDSASVVGFNKASANDNFNVTVVEIATNDPNLISAAITKALSAQPKVDIIVAARESLARQAVAAGAGAKGGGSGVLIVGADGSQSELGEMRLAATVDQRPEAQGDATVRDLAYLVRQTVCPNGQKPPCPTRIIELQPIYATKK